MGPDDEVAYRTLLHDPPTRGAATAHASKLLRGARCAVRSDNLASEDASEADIVGERW